MPAVLPHGPIQQQDDPFDPLVEMYRTTEQNYTDLTKRTLSILQGLTGQARDPRGSERAGGGHPPSRDPRGSDNSGSNKELGQWADGPKFVWKGLSSPKANDRVKSNPVSRAWSRMASWLRVVKANSSAKLTQSATWKLLHYDHQLHISDTDLQ